MNIHHPVSTNYGYFFEKFQKEWKEVSEELQKKFSEAVEEVLMPKMAMVDILTLVIKKEHILTVLKDLKDSFKFDFLTDYTATDEEIDPRFFIVIHLMSTRTKARIRIKIKVKESESFPSLISLWEGANWAEREIFDMFGIHFDGHPDLRRILMDIRWEGHPLRKDYPLRGYQVFLTPEPLDPELLK